MKKSITLIGLILVSVTYFSCKKDSGSSSSGGSGYSFHGNSYTETQGYDISQNSGGTPYNTVIGRGASSDNKKFSQFEFIFAGSAKPAAGTYQVVDTSGTTLGAKQVLVYLTDSIPVSNTFSAGFYITSGGDGSTVTVSANSSGKLSLVLSSAKIAGYYYDNTIPTNTQIVNVSTTASGTFTEQ